MGGGSEESRGPHLKVGADTLWALNGAGTVLYRPDLAPQPEGTASPKTSEPLFSRSPSQAYPWGTGVCGLILTNTGIGQFVLPKLGTPHAGNSKGI